LARGMARIVEKVPGWVEKLLIPTLESRVRGIVREEVEHLEKVMEARFQSVDARMESVEKRVNTRFDELEKRVNTRFDELEKRVNTRFDELEKRIDVIQRLAILEAQVKELRETHGRAQSQPTGN